MPEEPTTPNLVELSGRVLDVMSQRDFDTVASCYAPDAVFRGPEIGAFEGADAIRGFLEDWLTPYEWFQAEREEIIDLGNGVTFAVTMLKGRLVGSNGELQLRFPSVTTWSKGLIERQTNYSYMDVDEARAAAERLAKERG